MFRLLACMLYIVRHFCVYYLNAWFRKINEYKNTVAFRAYETRLSKRLKKKVTIRHKVQFQWIETNSNVRMYKSRSQPGLSIMLWKLECDKSPRESQITKLPENSKTSIFISAEKAVKLAFQQSWPAAAISHSEAERESSALRNSHANVSSSYARRRSGRTRLAENAARPKNNSLFLQPCKGRGPLTGRFTRKARSKHRENTRVGARAKHNARQRIEARIEYKAISDEGICEGRNEDETQG